jgi:hypothetical protein
MFVEFLGLVEKHHGLDTVDAIVDHLDGELTTGGAYTTVGNYPHGELLAMAVTLCSLTGAQMPAVLRAFAAHLMGVFRRMHGEYFDTAEDVFAFLMSVEHHIHVDVRKLYPDARPPLVRGQMLDDGAMQLTYESTRPLAQLALSMTEMAGEAFGQPLAIKVLDRSEDGRRITLKLRRHA